MGLLHNKVAIITGASSGIGRAAALLFSAEGAAVVLSARGEVALRGVAETIRAQGGQAQIVVGDVSSQYTHEELIEVALRSFGGLDIAFNNAAIIGPVKPLSEVTLAEWDETISVTFTSAFLGARAQIPAMLDRKGGSIIFTSSFVGASVGLPGMSAYAAAKAGLMGLVKGITADYADQGKCINGRGNGYSYGG